jgi:hypothetical protein
MTSGFRAFIAILALVLATLAPRPAMAAGKRVALVIGNSAYQKSGALPNPARDAAAVEAMLKMAGFTVTRATDVGASAMRRALRDFAGEVRDADIAAVFYAGHGIEVNGANYLVPVDAVMERDIDVEDEAVPLDRISQILEPARRLRLIMLDACRDNPFLRTMKRTMATRSIGRGLAKVEVLSTDTLVAYAARAGSTAEDGDGSNSPYTTALIKHLTTPGLDLRLAFGRVRDEVLKTTGNRQEPFVYGSLGGAEVALVEKEGNAPASPAVTAGVTPSSEAERAWGLVKDTTAVAVLEAFVARFKDTFYADLAKAKIEELKKAQEAKRTAAATPTPTPTPTPAPEAASGGVAIPRDTFFARLASGQSLDTSAALIGANVLDQSGRVVGAIKLQIMRGETAIGLVFDYKGKPIGLRLGSVLVSVDHNAPSVTVRVSEAVLAALPAYGLAGASDAASAAIAAAGENDEVAKLWCKSLAKAACMSSDLCEWDVSKIMQCRPKRAATGGR